MILSLLSSLPFPFLTKNRSPSPTLSPQNLSFPPIPPLRPLTADHAGEGHDGDPMSTCFPALASANVMRFKSGYYNVQVAVGDDEPEEVLMRRFRRAVMRAGVLKECRRRMFFEDKQAKKKRKAREAARKNRRHRPYKPKSPPAEEQEASKEPKEEEEDNWELPEGKLPY